jgi:hypothetical protein
MAAVTDDKISLSKQTVESAEGPPSSVKNGVLIDDESQSQEVFQKSADGVDFRTVTWQRLIIILLKIQVATGVLGIPGAMGTLGAVPGALSVVGWQALNTCELHIKGRELIPMR